MDAVGILRLGETFGNVAQRQEGIFMRGVEQHDLQALAEFAQRLRDLRDRKRAVAQAGQRAAGGIGRQQVVVAIDLHRITGEIDEEHRVFRLFGKPCEIVERREHGKIVGIGDARHVEIGAFQRLADKVDVVQRVFQRFGILVFGIADEERIALGSKGRRGREEKQTGGKRPDHPMDIALHDNPPQGNDQSLATRPASENALTHSR